MRYQTKHIVVDAIQFTGVESVPAVQAFIAPQSPLFGPGRNSTDRPSLAIIARNRIGDAQWPSIAPHYEQVSVVLNAWILREADGEFAVMVDEEFRERFEPVVEQHIEGFESPSLHGIPEAIMSVPGPEDDWRQSREGLSVPMSEIPPPTDDDRRDPDPTTVIDATDAQAAWRDKYDI